jgi:hypothetical protein
MTFETGELTRCSGGNHYRLPITIGQTTRTLHFSRDELEGEPPASLEEAKREILNRLCSAVKEASATTFAQARTALENKTFKV